MSQTGTAYPISDVLAVTIVVAVSTLAAIAIAAWLVLQVAQKAIDKATPEGVAPVIVALGALLHPLRMFLPWSSLGRQSLSLRRTGNPLHNEDSPQAPQEAGYDNQR